jgi:virginiamycin B lyase
VQSVAVDLSARSKGCKRSSKGLACNVKLSLAPAKYTANFSTYSGAVSKGKPTGKLLSANQKLPLNVPSKGLSISIDNDLAGIPASVAFDMSETTLAGGPTAYTMSRCVNNQIGLKEPFYVYSLDAAGYIMMGKGAPAISLASSNVSYLSYLIIGGSSSASEEYALVVAYKSTPPLGSIVTLTGTAKPQKGSGAKAVRKKITVTFNSSAGCFTVFNVPTKYMYGDNLPSIALGPDGNMWFTEFENNKIGRIVPSTGIVSEFSLASGNHPAGITVGPSAILSFTASGAIGFITDPAAGIIEYQTPGWSVTDETQPTIANGPDGRLWFGTDCGQIVAYNPSTKQWAGPWSTELPCLSSANLTAGPDGNMWFTEGSAVGKLTPSGQVTNYPLPSVSSRTNPSAMDITGSSDGNLWFATSGGYAQIGKITTSGAITYYPLSAAPSCNDDSTLYRIIDDSNGNLWFTGDEGCDNAYPDGSIDEMTTSGVLTRFIVPPSTVSSGRVYRQPLALAFDATGNLWFTDNRNNQILEFQPK